MASHPGLTGRGGRNSRHEECVSMHSRSVDIGEIEDLVHAMCLHSLMVNRLRRSGRAKIVRDHIIFVIYHLRRNCSRVNHG